MAWDHAALMTKPRVALTRERLAHPTLSLPVNCSSQRLLPPWRCSVWVVGLQENLSRPGLSPSLVPAGSTVLGGRFEAPHLQAHGGPESLFSPVPGPGTVDSQGQIEFLRCFATLKTKSQTKFYLEFHSSCLESKGLRDLFLLAVGPTLPLQCLSMGGPLPHCSSRGRTHGCISRGVREVGLQAEGTGGHQWCGGSPSGLQCSTPGTGQSLRS